MVRAPRKKYVWLVWWPHSERSKFGPEYKTSVKWSECIPDARVKKGAQAGSMVKLAQKVKKKTIYVSAKLVKRGTEEDLKYVEVNDLDGSIIPAGTKGYTADVMEVRKAVQTQKRVTNKAIRTAMTDESLGLHEAGIFIESHKAAGASGMESHRASYAGASGMASVTPEAPSNTAPASVSSEAVESHILRLLYPQVTPENYYFLETMKVALGGLRGKSRECDWWFSRIDSLLGQVESLLADKADRGVQPPMVLGLSTVYFKGGAGMVPLYDGAKVFVPIAKKTVIDTKMDNNGTWEDYTSIVLTTIYGRTLAWYSAEGKRGTVGLSSRVTDAVYDFVVEKYEENLERSRFNDHINHLIHNRRRLYKRKADTENLRTESQVEKNGRSHSPLSDSVTVSSSCAPPSQSGSDGSSGSQRSMSPISSICSNLSQAKPSMQTSSSPMRNAVSNNIQPTPFSQLTPYPTGPQGAGSAQVIPFQPWSPTSIQGSPTSGMQYMHSQPYPPGPSAPSATFSEGGL